jgi:outer membrane protein with beta-barrel domain
LRKLATLAPVLAFMFLVQFASAQQGDVMFGGGTLLSSSPSNNVSFQPSEKGGAWLNVSADVVAFKKRIGINWETAWRASQGAYAQQENFRPILTDFNALWQPRLGKKVGLDLFGGIGLSSTRFYLPEITSCSFTGCINYDSSHHFMEDLGGGIRYYVWHHLFVRPEIHYYHVQNNVEFNTDNLFRVGASVGYTIGPD